MLISLYACAMHSRSENPVLRDPWAEQAVDQCGLRLRFHQAFQDPTAFDRHPCKAVRHLGIEWITDNPESTVLHLGCGLDSRVFRVDPPSTVNWFDIDYPEVIDLRRQLYPDTLVTGWSAPRCLGRLA